MVKLMRNATLVLQLLAALQKEKETKVEPIYHPPALLSTFDKSCSFKVYEKDTCLSNPFQNYIKSKRNVITCPRWLWPQGVVPYVMRIADSEILAKFTKAKEAIESASCVRFVPDSEGSGKFLTVIRSRPVAGDRCKATVGTAVPHPQLHLSEVCSVGQVIHELLHVLGFAHEHTRPDRDQFVRVLCNNILTNMTSDFKRLRPGIVTSYGEPYDFYSIMHYRLNHFSRNGKNTLEPLVEVPNLEKIGEMKEMSDGDVRKLNKLYQCDSLYHVIYE